ncbi:SAM-dependent methyltransferase [candidate division WOR-1 bacterium RIFOXYB2_FULL_42_35]|uniref:SAM-dependent methyltransferase n=1 Tax=candidate division WOR-1 bacterium RIFOXYC2_FULL_41_25 TaxID=1802586 RepID=A0A1F4TN59_UNCSA|nr:MAG: SAM-dependent methyltransferase [candidate division WOR-1 bacterium RIFOXYA2_FULL_41_14]OGC24647.1 MAG: SAM-dependent methyltransferase [candidate division WOR-1 bacterium RIFOXYB2_FULL_42_35]OGC34162.1 MAG: SAM-dependent methyltransferase [candidate division WOR-1 bacterium RIFOXYC2_FULL_41_25]OGC42274.1 MAG: SAM-dependent methyltransferase [candidate division WOR-1 bacterium RIFOXYD2_FULL_41_8]
MPKWNAKKYSQSSSAQQKWAEELINKLSLTGQERILDIGCGDGKITAEIAGHLTNGYVLGIDNSEEMISFARENHPGIDFKVGDARKLNFDQEFDLVFSNAALHWVVDHLSVLKGIKNSLKSGGEVLLQMGGRGNAGEMLKIAEELMAGGKWSSFFKDFVSPFGFYGVEEYEKWLAQVGLKARRVELIPKDMVQQGKTGMFAWISTTWMPYIEKIPQNFQAEFINQLINEYLSRYPLDDKGLAHVQMIRLEVEANKE